MDVTRLALGLFGSGLQDYHAVKHGTLKMAVQEERYQAPMLFNQLCVQHFMCMTVMQNVSSFNLNGRIIRKIRYVCSNTLCV